LVGCINIGVIVENFDKPPISTNCFICFIGHQQKIEVYRNPPKKSNGYGKTDRSKKAITDIRKVQKRIKQSM